MFLDVWKQHSALWPHDFLFVSFLLLFVGNGYFGLRTPLIWYVLILNSHTFAKTLLPNMVFIGTGKESMKYQVRAIVNLRTGQTQVSEILCEVLNLHSAIKGGALPV